MLYSAQKTIKLDIVGGFPALWEEKIRKNLLKTVKNLKSIPTLQEVNQPVSSKK